jgi:ubiquinone/menaquinone biosynthesis C-methylase UbiE
MINYKIKLKALFKLLNLIKKTKPYLAIFILHELFRNLYPEDKYLYFTEKNHEKRVLQKIDELIKLLLILKNIKTYKKEFYLVNSTKNLFDRNHEVFSKIFIKEIFQKDSKKYLVNLKKLGLEKKYFKDKMILDAGTGSGRHAYLMSKFSPKKIIALDNKLTIRKNLNYKFPKNIFFMEGDVQRTKFKNSTFDFINCYGVLHHTRNIEKGIKELLRILKKNGYLFLYIYGSGGIYWEVRKKMNKFFKNIPQDYTSNFFKIMNVPKSRLIFQDCWYAPIEIYTSKNKLEKILNKQKIQGFKKLNEEYVEKNKSIWSDGELKYLVKK